jgi:hypothetical protein
LTIFKNYDKTTSSSSQTNKKTRNFREQTTKEVSMSHCFFHAVSSAKKFGGLPLDYLALHEWFDQVKVAFNFPTHRAILHNTFGVALAMEIFGPTLTRASDGQPIDLEPVIRLHLEEDLGMVPTLEQWLGDLSGKFEIRPVTLDSDFTPIAEFFETPRRHWNDPRATVILHNTVGIYLCEQRLGQLFTRPNNRVIPTRLIAEKYVMRATGRLPTIQEQIGKLDISPAWRRNGATKLSERYANEYDYV